MTSEAGERLSANEPGFASKPFFCDGGLSQELINPNGPQTLIKEGTTEAPDMEIKVGDRSKSVHSKVFHTYSTVLGEDSKANILDLTDTGEITVEGIDVIIGWMYLGSAQLKLSDLYSTFEAAVSLGMYKLVNALNEYIISAVTKSSPSEIISLMRTAFSLNGVGFNAQNSLMKWAIPLFPNLVALPAFQTLPKLAIILLLQHDRLPIASELTVLKVLLEWMDNKELLTRKPLTACDLRILTDTVRLGQMTDEEQKSALELIDQRRGISSSAVAIRQEVMERIRLVQLNKLLNANTGGRCRQNQSGILHLPSLSAPPRASHHHHGRLKDLVT